MFPALASVAQLVEGLSHTLKGHGFDSLLGYLPGLQVQSLVMARTGVNQ